MKIRGTLTIGIMGIFLFTGDLFQRTVIQLLVLLFPSRRQAILGRWIRFVSAFMVEEVRFVGGAGMGGRIKLPGRPGVLIVGNHQSLLDLPIAIRSVAPLTPRVVTRARYARGKPLISHTVRLYQYPTVDPRATGKSDLEALRKTAEESEVPILIYPEGTRTKDGEIGKLRRGGLRAMLPTRKWEVWVVTVDGFWECAKLEHFVERVSSIDGSSRVDGPIEFDGNGASEEEVDAFIDRIHEEMKKSLLRLRGQEVA